MELIILGHIIGDFYVQTDKIAEKKKNIMKYMLLHCVIYSIIVGICFYLLGISSWRTIGIIGIILLTHFIIDMLKRECDKKYARYEYLFFVVDQALHMLILFFVFYFTKDNLENQMKAYSIVNGVNIRKCIMEISSFLICWKPVKIFISLIFDVIPKTVEQAGETVTDESYIENEELKIGAWIGILEREIILLLGLMGQYSAIGFVLTAKSLARFKQLENKSFAEKYLVGTLLSSFIAIVCIAICKIECFT